jgi:hypothetical protein
MGNDVYYVSVYEKYFSVYKFEGNYNISLLCGRNEQIPVAARSKSQSAVTRSLGLWFRIPPVPYVSVSWSVVYFQAEATASGRSLVQRSSTKCDHEASIMRITWPPMG